MALLVRTQGGQAGKWVYPVGRHCVLGRHAECDVADLFTNDPGVSRFHAQIDVVEGRHAIEDRGSRNGTYVNGQRISGRVPLRSGDRLVIGGVELIFIEETGGLGPALSPAPQRPELVSIEEPAGSATPLSRLAVPASGASVPAAGHSADRLRALTQMIKGLARTLEIDTALRELLAGLFGIFHQAESAFVAFTAEGQEDLLPRATQFRRPDPRHRVRLSRTLVRHVLSQREAVLWADRQPGPIASGTLNEMGVRSLMCAPLLDGDGQPFGIVQIDTDHPVYAFTPEDPELMAAAVSQAALAVRYAKLHEETLRRQVLQRDLELARRVQLGLLPEAYPDREGFEFFAYYRAAYEVGGDYYDFIALPQDRLALVMADAAGKGVSAALVVAKLAGELKYRLSCEPPGTALAQMNESLCTSDTGQFVTLLAAILDRRSSVLTLVNAGHPAPLRRRAHGGVEAVGEAARGPALGLFPGRQYQDLSLTIDPGDVWLAYTDGFSEALSATGEMFGAPRLRQCLADAPGVVGESGQRIVRDVLTFQGHQPQSDDMCLVAWGLLDPSAERTGELAAASDLTRVIA